LLGEETRRPVGPLVQIWPLERRLERARLTGPACVGQRRELEAPPLAVALSGRQKGGRRIPLDRPRPFYLSFCGIPLLATRTASADNAPTLFELPIPYHVL
jgi:hypothetical protein